MDEAVDILRNHGLLIYPTETYLGIGCRVGSEDAISRVFKVKKRLYAMPLPLIVSDAAQVDMVAQIPPALRADVSCLQEQFWPGPLALILPARKHISPLLTGGTGKIALRASPHPVPGELAQKLAEPIVASSANISGQAPVIHLSQLNAELLQGVDGVFNAPPEPAGGAASTLVEPLGDKKLLVHRVGAVDLSQFSSTGFHLEQKL